jgi:superfamily II DNA or RNA helicase
VRDLRDLNAYFLTKIFQGKVKKMINPRPYQTDAVNTVMDRWNAGITRQIVNLPTGTGKTPTAAMVVQRFGGRTLFLAHRDELLRQAIDKIGLIIPSPNVGIFKAQEREGLDKEICVASVQTATRHTDLLKDRGFNLCICDESHHALAESYIKVFDNLDFMNDNPQKLLVGFTATAFRGDGGALGDVFQEIVYERSILAMIKGGYLCDIRGISIKTESDLDGVRTKQGDFITGDLAEAIDNPERNQLIADAYLEHVEDRKAIVFCVDVHHSQHVAATMEANGISCRAVYGDLDIDERREVLAAFAAGEIRVLANCNLLTEGWDSPDLGAVLMARPTKSRVFYIQCIGRGLRTAPGKDDCLLIDFVDIADKHNICALGTLAGDESLNPRKGQSLLQAIDEKNKERERRDGGVAFTTDYVSEEFSLFERSRFAWLVSGHNFRLSISDGKTIVCSPRSGGYGVYLLEGDGTMTYLSSSILPLGYAQGVAEDFARKNAQMAYIDKNAKWREGMATEKQLDALARMGVPTPPGLTKGEAHRLIGEVINAPITERQLSFIRRNGLHRNPTLLTKREARALISRYQGRYGATA